MKIKLRSDLRAPVYGIGGTSLAWALLYGGCHLITRPNLAPIERGMTVAEIGRARPGHYTRDIAYTEIKRAADLAPATRRDYTGEFRLRRPGYEEVALGFSRGRMQAWSVAHLRPAVSNPPPAGTTLDEVLRRLPADADVRIPLPFGDRQDYELPRDAPKLARFTGTLSGVELHWGEMTEWRVRFVAGRAASIHQETYDW